MFSLVTGLIYMHTKKKNIEHLNMSLNLNYYASEITDYRSDIRINKFTSML